MQIASFNLARVNYGKASTSTRLRASVARRSSCPQGPLPVRRLAAPTTCKYKFGDFTRKAAQKAKQRLDQLGQNVTGDSDYQVGDLTKKLIKDIKAKSPEVMEQLEGAGRTLVDKVSAYQFGSITRGALRSEWGQKLVASAQSAGVALTGREDYKLGDLTQEIRERLVDAKDRTEKILALPSEVDALKQVVLEQQLLIDSLSNESPMTKEMATELQALPSDIELLQQNVLDQQDIIDVYIQSMDE
mmetsp:Transcript_35789/g.43210  ORF Transcript_35789/g.43210 Transcript_35789/m.43210 type:complete len:245 (-) Transcript_35789:219-953(-)|eukprot:CAMPEP_0197857142 /NCGR_PEP_ID=MMETSP1438-20131217/29935_1 /TAXON_ID=1461541 /ORGANISM="Pterosperma sp., Strain CCMP1384" /LENGTH=244 /DNA_ID=CAMNT_0043472865 /DNA_START=148 /DNA_END=882 /DNA_ORIENTATION=-